MEGQFEDISGEVSGDQSFVPSSYLEEKEGIRNDVVDDSRQDLISTILFEEKIANNDLEVPTNEGINGNGITPDQPQFEVKTEDKPVAECLEKEAKVATERERVKREAEAAAAEAACLKKEAEAAAEEREHLKKEAEELFEKEKIRMQKQLDGEAEKEILRMRKKAQEELRKEKMKLQKQVKDAAEKEWIRLQREVKAKCECEKMKLKKLAKDDLDKEEAQKKIRAEKERSLNKANEEEKNILDNRKIDQQVYEEERIKREKAEKERERARLSKEKTDKQAAEIARVLKLKAEQDAEKARNEKEKKDEEERMKRKKEQVSVVKKKKEQVKPELLVKNDLNSKPINSEIQDEEAVEREEKGKELDMKTVALKRKKG